MKQCFICKKDTTDSNSMSVFRLGKEGIVIPSGMSGRDAICKECFAKEKDQYKGSSLYVNPMGKGLHIGSGKLTKEKFLQWAKQIRENGLQMIDENAPYFVAKLEDRYPTIESELQRILSPYVISDGDYIGSSLKRVIDYENSANYQMRDRELDTLEFFLRNLKDIETYDKIVFETFKQKIINALSKGGDFFGVRAEVMTCSILIRNKVTFKPIPESPPDETADFAVNNNCNILIECASTHLEEKREGDLMFKIRRTIRDKSSKLYAKPNTVLFVDATNVFYNSMLNHSEIDGNLRDNVSKMLEESNFGTVLVFRYIFENRPNRRLTYGHYRFDNKVIDSELSDFLNTNFPLGKYVVDKFYQPPRG